jgi:acyl-CoA synthetase (AMP-forming)/AMP-acid ligase II
VPERPLHAVVLPPSAAAGPFLDAVSAALDGTGPAILPLDPGLPAARLRELLDAFAPTAIQTPEGTQQGPAARAASPPPSRPGLPPGTAAVIVTSGSTGPPKGVALSAAALRASAAGSLARIGARPGQRWLCCLPAFHVAGLQVLVRSLLAGTVPLVSERVDADVIEQVAAAAPGAHVSLVPTQLRRLLDAGAPLRELGTILLGGAAPPAGLVDQAVAAGARVVTTYGMSETCGGCVYDGRPLDGVRVRTGDGGLIQIAGPVLFSGYWPAGGGARLPGGRPGSEAAAGGWFTTSDLGELDAGGRLTVRGRADDVINTGGEKVLPGEVEAVLGTITGVRDVVVVGTPDPEWGELVTAIVVPADPAAPPDLGRLRAGARDRLPGYAAPRGLVLMPEIPLLASGKPDRRALREVAAGPTATRRK